MKYLTHLIVAAVLVAIGIVGCSKLPEQRAAVPVLADIPTQQATVGVEMRVDLATYADDVTRPDLTWNVVAGQGTMQASEYVATFTTLGSNHITVRATHDGEVAERTFKVAALFGHMAVVQNGNGIQLLDGESGAIATVDEGGSSQLIFRSLLPDGSLVYERMGGSGVRLFHYNYAESRQVAGSVGMDTRFDGMTQTGQLFYTQGSAQETALCFWDPATDQHTTIAQRPMMHNRHAVQATDDLVYFEYGNNSQNDIYYWRIGEQHPATGYSSDFPETIKVALPDGGIIFASTGLSGEADLYYCKVGRGTFTVGGDLPQWRQDQDMTYVGTTSEGLVVFETGNWSRDLWVWHPLGLTTRMVAATSTDERCCAITPDDLIVYKSIVDEENHDLRIYNYSQNTSTDIAATAALESYELTLPDSDVVYAVSVPGTRSLYRYDAATRTSEAIAAVAGAMHASVHSLKNGRVVYSRASAPQALLTWNPTTRQTTTVGGSEATFAGEGPHGGFLFQADNSGQSDLMLWNGTTGQVEVVAATPDNDLFQAAFTNGSIFYSTVVPPKTTADLFRYRAGASTRITDSSAPVTVVNVLRGDV